MKKTNNKEEQYLRLIYGSTINGFITIHVCESELSELGKMVADFFREKKLKSFVTSTIKNEKKKKN